MINNLAVKAILMKHVKYSSIDELKDYLEQIRVTYPQKCLKRDLVKLIDENTLTDGQLFELSKYVYISSTSVKELLQISDHMLQQMRNCGYIIFYKSRWFNDQKINLYNAYSVLIMQKYGIPSQFRGSGKKLVDPNCPNIDGIYVTPEELAAIRGIRSHKVYDAMRDNEIAYISTSKSSLIPLTQFKRPCFWEVS